MREPSRARAAARAIAALVLAALAACDGRDGHRREDRPGAAVVTLPGSLLGAEGEALARQIARFEAEHPGVDVVLLETPDSADERHQLYVQWLSAGIGDPDVLQLDVVWIPEFAAAGWIRPLDDLAGLDTADFFPNVLAADRWEGALHAVPWFVDVGMLYWRTDLFEHAPATLEELAAMTERARRGHGIPPVTWGLALQGARYEGLVTVFVELLGAFGGRILDDRGRVAVDSEAAVAALTWLRDAVRAGVVPELALTWREEPARLAFQDGRAAFLRNWPYAWALLADADESEVAGRFAVAPMPPARGRGEATACLGGQHLAVNARSESPEAALALVRFLARPEEMLERARSTGQLPPRPSLYAHPVLTEASPIPPEQALEIVRRARPRPVTPVWSELSRALQAPWHAALTDQREPAEALAAAAATMRAVLATHARAADGDGQRGPQRAILALAALAAAWAVLRIAKRARRSARELDAPAGEVRTALLLGSPAIAVIVLVAAFPLLWTLWTSLHRHDLRAPGSAGAFVGLANYAEALGDPRFRGALAHTAAFTATSVALELLLGLALALTLDRAFRGRGLARAAVLLPWALPTVVAALVWRFLFEGSAAGLANAVLLGAGAIDEPFVWLGHPLGAWVPLVLADVWKTTPFVTLLLLAGLQTIDRELLEAARVDGAGALARLRHVILPLLRPVLVVVLLFRTLDAIRVFDLVYALTGGGPGTATEPIALLAFDALLGSLRFGYGSALATVVFLLALALALLHLRGLGRDAGGVQEERA